MPFFLGSVTPHWDMCHCIGIRDSALDDDRDSTSSSYATWTIPWGWTCSFQPFLEVVEVVRKYIFRATSFRGSYLLTECPKFCHSSVIRCRMTVGFPKCGHSRKLGKTRHSYGVLKSVARKMLLHFDHLMSLLIPHVWVARAFFGAHLFSLTSPLTCWILLRWLFSWYIIFFAQDGFRPWYWGHLLYFPMVLLDHLVFAHGFHSWFCEAPHLYKTCLLFIVTWLKIIRKTSFSCQSYCIFLFCLSIVLGI